VKVGRGLVIATVAVAASFLLGLWTRAAPSETSHGNSERDEPNPASPSRIGTSRVVPRGFTRDGAAELAPGAAHEDVMTLVALGHSLEDLYTVQVRDERWAPHVENFLRSEISAFFALVLPEAQELEVECKESTCKIAFVVPADREDVAYSRQQAMPVAEVLEPWDERLADGRVRVGIYIGFGDHLRPLDKIQAFYREQYQGRFGAVPGAELVKYFEQHEAEIFRSEAP
jgi:hypothetical protein